MQELVFKNYLKSLLIFIAGICVSSAVSTIDFYQFGMPLPVLILGTLAGFLALSFILYSRASTGQALQIAITGILINSALLAATYFATDYLNLPRMVLKPDFILHINPIIVATGSFFTIFALSYLMKLEEIKEATPEPEPEPEPEPHPVMEKTPQEKPPPLQEDVDFIPTDIRLVENAESKEDDQKAKIGAIGKLLVQNKDLETLSEDEEILKTRVNVISTVSGDKIYAKFNELKSEFSCIKEIALIDQGGFILATNFEDTQRAQIAGALVSGAYHTIQNYLAQISLPFPIRIFFETEYANGFIVKTKEEILFSIWHKEFELVEYGPMGELLEPEADQAITNVTTAIFENIKVFLMNIQLIKLTKIVVFTTQKAITMVKSENRIDSYLTDPEDLPKVSEKLLKMEEMT